MELIPALSLPVGSAVFVLELRGRSDVLLLGTRAGLLRGGTGGGVTPVEGVTLMEGVTPMERVALMEG